jgi:hypothetical protein
VLFGKNRGGFEERSRLYRGVVVMNYASCITKDFEVIDYLLVQNRHQSTASVLHGLFEVA